MDELEKNHRGVMQQRFKKMDVAEIKILNARFEKWWCGKAKSREMAVALAQTSDEEPQRKIE